MKGQPPWTRNHRNPDGGAGMRPRLSLGREPLIGDDSPHPRSGLAPIDAFTKDRALRGLRVPHRINLPGPGVPIRVTIPAAAPGLQKILLVEPHVHRPDSPTPPAPRPADASRSGAARATFHSPRPARPSFQIVRDRVPSWRWRTCHLHAFQRLRLPVSRRWTLLRVRQPATNVCRQNGASGASPP